MELQELVARIQRWQGRQGGAAPSAQVHEVHHHRTEPVEEVAQAVAEEVSGEIEVESESVVSEEPTSEVALEQIEDQR